MFVISTMAAEHLAEKLGKRMRVLYPALNKEGARHFPDGELYVKIPQATRLFGKHVTVLHAGTPNPNEGLIELELILQTLQEVRAFPIDVFFAYFPYGMQDEVFAKGETNVAENLIGKLYRYYKVRTISIVDAHFAGKQWHQKYPLQLLSAVPQLVAAAKRDFGDDIIFIAPDKGGRRRTNIKHMHKKRKNSYELSIQSSSRMQNAMKGKTVAVVDDLVETGGTLEKCYEECRKAGAKKVIALITHGVLPEGIARVKKKYDKLYLTNTISRPQTNVDITPLMLQFLI